MIQYKNNVSEIRNILNVFYPCVFYRHILLCQSHTNNFIRKISKSRTEDVTVDFAYHGMRSNTLDQ